LDFSEIECFDRYDVIPENCAMGFVFRIVKALEREVVDADQFEASFDDPTRGGGCQRHIVRFKDERNRCPTAGIARFKEQSRGFGRNSGRFKMLGFDPRDLIWNVNNLTRSYPSLDRYVVEPTALMNEMKWRVDMGAAMCWAYDLRCIAGIAIGCSGKRTHFDCWIAWPNWKISRK